MFKGVMGDAFDASPFVLTAFLIFFVFFSGVVVWTVFLSKKYTDKMRNLPLEDDQTHNLTT
jgi:hypothetical protein